MPLKKNALARTLVEINLKTVHVVPWTLHEFSRRNRIVKLVLKAVMYIPMAIAFAYTLAEVYESEFVQMLTAKNT